MAKEKYNWAEIFKKLDEGSTLKDMVNEYGMAMATVSRKYSAYKQGEAIGRNDTNADEAIERLANKELRVLKEQKKNAYLRQKVNKAAREFSLVDVIADTIAEMDIKSYKSEKIDISEETSLHSKQMFVISDLHYVDSERSSSLTKMGKMLYQNWDGSSDIDIIFNGDLIENTHHVSQLLDKNSANPIIQATEVANVIAIELTKFMDNLPKDVFVRVLWTLGNHDEIRQLTKAGEEPSASIVYIVSELVRSLTNDIDDLTICNPQVESSFMFGDGSTIHFRHGHTLKSNRQEAVEQFLIKESVLNGKLHNTYVISHFHQFRQWIMKGSKDNTMVILTPSMKDWNGEFENRMNMSNTSGMTSISFDERNNRIVKYIPIPK